MRCLTGRRGCCVRRSSERRVGPRRRIVRDETIVLERVRSRSNYNLKREARIQVDAGSGTTRSRSTRTRKDPTAARCFDEVVSGNNRDQAICPPAILGVRQHVQQAPCKRGSKHRCSDGKDGHYRVERSRLVNDFRQNKPVWRHGQKPGRPPWLPRFLDGPWNRPERRCQPTDLIHLSAKAASSTTSHTTGLAANLMGRAGTARQRPHQERGDPKQQ